MSYQLNPLEIPNLELSLRSLVEWEKVALHLPKIEPFMIDAIKREASTLDEAKMALYTKWLNLYSEASWTDVVSALQMAEMNSLAEEISRKCCVNNLLEVVNVVEYVEEPVDKKIVQDLSKLHSDFTYLVMDVLKKFDESLSLDCFDPSNLLLFVQLQCSFYNVKDFSNLHTRMQLCELISTSCTFLDFEPLKAISTQLPNATDLQTRVEAYVSRIRAFRNNAPIKHLKERVSPLISRFNRGSAVFVIFKLQDAWEQQTMGLVDILVKTLFPHTIQKMQWYSVEPGSIRITFLAPFDCNADSVGNRSSFLKLVGCFSLVINGSIVLQEEKNENYSFQLAFIEASQMGNIEAVEFLLTTGVNIDCPDSNDNTALILASGCGDKMVLECCHASVKATLNTINSFMKIVEALLKAKANPNHQGKDGNTALHIACYAGYTRLAVLLLEFGASLTVTNAKGDTPFLSSVRGKMMEAVMMIAPKLPKLKIPPAVLLACRLGYSDIISCLLQYIDPPSSRIHHYCANGDLALAAQHIVEFNGDVDSTLELGITPLMIASSCGHIEIVECLIEANASVKCVDQDGYSALAYAIVGSKSLAVVECLLQAQGDPFITVGGDNLLQIAKANSDLTDLLLQYMALQLYNMYSSLVEKIQRDLANEVAVHKVTVQGIKSKLLSDPDFSHIEGIAKVSSCSELFTFLRPHHDFLSWKVISFLSNYLKQVGYFQLVEVFEANLEIENFSKVIQQLESNVFPSTCNELTLSLHRQWGIQSMSNLRRLNYLLFSSLARLMSHITVSVTQQEILVTYQMPKSMKLAERIKLQFFQMQLCEKFEALGVVQVVLNGEHVSNIDYCQFFSFQSSIFYAIEATSLFSSETLKFLKFLSGLKDTDPNYKSVEGKTALLVAAVNGYSSVVDFLLSIGAEPDAGNDDGYTPLIAASSEGHLDIVKSLVHSCPSSVNTAASNGCTPLMVASLCDKTDVVQFLLKHSSNQNMSTADGFTALKLASFKGFVEIVKLLLEAGADPNMIDNDGYTALMNASRNGHSATVRLLLRYNADHRHTRLVQGIPCDSFAHACSSGNMETVHIFLDAGIVDRSLSIGWYMACLYNQSHLIKYLIYSLPQVSFDGRELVTACVKGDLVHLKKVHHPDNVEFVHGVTLLMVACSCGHTGIVKALLDAGASVSRSDEFGFKAVDYCKEHSPISNILSTKEMTKRTFNENLFDSFAIDDSLRKGIPSLSTSFNSLNLAV